jgi:hypothetical protein
MKLARRLRHEMSAMAGQLRDDLDPDGRGVKSRPLVDRERRQAADLIDKILKGAS